MTDVELAFSIFLSVLILTLFLCDSADSLELQNNQLSGPIPAEIGSVTNDGPGIGIQLQNNQLTGTIPAEMGSIEKLSKYWSGLLTV